MGRPRRKIYFFISNANGEYYVANYTATGVPVINKSGNPMPLKYNPANLKGLRIEMATNKKYNSLNRNVTYPFQFIKDGADILRSLDYAMSGVYTVAYITMIEYNPERGVYELYYNGKIDFSKKKDLPLKGYTVNCVSAGAWGIISQRDDIEFQIPCNATNPKAIRVLFDGITLIANITYQPVAFVLPEEVASHYMVVPIIVASVDGDSSGIITEDMGSTVIKGDPADNNPLLHMQRNPFDYILRVQYPTTITIKGTFSYAVNGNFGNGFGLTWYFFRSTDTETDPNNLPADRKLFIDNYADGTPSGIYTRSFNINQTFNLASGESIMLCYTSMNFAIFSDYTLTPIVSNIVITANTQTQPTTAFALRPLDLLQALVSKATNGLFTINSDYYTANNKVVLTSGDALRQSPNAYIKSTIADWFKSFDCQDYIALKIPNEEVWVEKWDEVYNQDNEILDVGEISDIELEADVERLIAAIEVGSPIQDYRHSSGKLEFNTTNKFSLDAKFTKNVLNLISVYRTDGYGIEFIRLDYQGGSTKDNKGDNSVFMVAITDEVDSATTLVSNFEVIQMNAAPLAPIITSPLDNDTISFPSPIVRGKAPSGTTVKIYVDGVLDGTVVAGAGNRWSYQILATLAPYEISGLTVVNDGVHTISATYTDMSGTIENITVNIIDVPSVTQVSYPSNLDVIWNNKPLIKGIAQEGTVVTVQIDGVVIGVVTADSSCKWSIQANVITNGTHILDVNGSTSNFTVDAFTSVPIITSFDGFVQIENEPLIEGVGIPGVSVNLYLDYYSDVPIGTAIIDSDGRWSIQTVPTLKSDGVTVLVPIPNGEHTISTSLDIENATVSTVGYKLNRPAYSSITGVTDDTVFNTTLSPKRMLLSRASLFASLAVQNKTSKITFESGDKNQSLSTTLFGVTVKENANINISSLEQHAFLPIIANFRTVVPSTFNAIFNAFNTGGVVRASFTGIELFFLPIGNMSVDDVTNKAQNWKLLISNRTSLTTLLNLSRGGLSLNIMKNSIYISDYNTLHFVKYNFSQSVKYNSLELYDDWYNNRNDRWIENPTYIQKLQRSDKLIQQIINNGVSGIVLEMYRCSDALLIDTFPFTSVAPAPIPAPDIVQEVEIDLTDYDEDQYFFVISVAGVSKAISERIETKDRWDKTILLECSQSYNLPGAMFSTGFQSILRVEGLVQKWSPVISVDTNKDEIGDNQMLHSVPSRQRTILIGDGFGLPDYLYLKASQFVQLNEVAIEGVDYVISEDSKMEENDRVAGHPAYHYSLRVEKAINDSAVVIEAGAGANTGGVTLIVDGDAFGSGGLIAIDVVDGG